MSPEKYQELRGRAFDFIARNGGPHLFEDVHKRRPPIDFEKPLNSIDREFVRKNGLSVAISLGMEELSHSPTVLNWVRDEAEIVIDGKKVLTNAVGQVSRLLTKGQLAQRLDHQSSTAIEPGQARLGVRRRAP